MEAMVIRGEMSRIITFFRWLKWYLKGKPMVQYRGYHCGICGKWVNEPFSVPEYQSAEEWWDTWGVCEECVKKVKGI